MKTAFIRFSLTLTSLLLLQLQAQNYNYTWMKGAPNNSLAVYGTLGVSNPSNTPASQSGGITWTDQVGNLWLYVGSGLMWKYSPTTNNWTWINGTNSTSLAAVYGTMGVSSTLNTPGTRIGSATWTDGAGNLWLFGGRVNTDPLNDLWRYNTSNNQWTWMGGTSTPSANPVYGTQSVPATTNIPRASWNLVSWKDPSGNFWLYDGLYGNEVWKYKPSTAQWAWMSGTSTNSVIPGVITSVFGTQGVSSPSVHPGERATSGVGDAAGNLYIFGGEIYHVGPFGRGNDLWKYNISTNQWTWVSGTQSSGHMGTYGTQGVFSSTTVPAGRRHGHVLWVDNNNKLWLFGGDFQSIVTFYCLNDTWCYDISTGQWAWMKGSSVPFSGNPADASAVYGTQTVASPSNTPGWRMSATYWTGDPYALWIYSGMGLVASTELWKLDGCTITPTVSINSSHTVLCAGSTATLTASGSVNSYSWNTGALTNTLSVSPSSTTVYFVSNTGNYCASSSAFTLAVTPQPTVSVSSSTSLTCAGSSVHLTATGANSYSWNTGQTSASFQTAPVATTVYTITGTTNNCSNVKTFTQQVQPLPVLVISSSTNQICSGNTAILSVSGASAYLWNTGQTISSISTSPLATTIYTVTGTTNGCSANGTFTQLVLQPPTLHVSGAEKVICTGETLTLTASGANTYTWNVPASNSNTIQISPVFTTFLSLAGTDNNGCKNTALVTVNVSDCLDIKELATGNNISIYPNPTSNLFYIKGGNACTLWIFNSQGQMVFEQKLELETTAINAHLTSGIYYCKILEMGKTLILMVE